MFCIPCVIFAGGKSSRMGEDKTLLPFGTSATLTQYQYTRLSKIFTNVFISCKEPTKFNFPAQFIQDKKGLSTFAPTIAFISVFEALACDSFFVISVDTPFISLKEIKTIIAADKTDNDATIAKTQGGVQTLCGIYHKSTYKKFLQMCKDDNHKLSHLLKNSNTTYVPFSQEEVFLNLNHPHEYEKALKLLQN